MLKFSLKALYILYVGNFPTKSTTHMANSYQTKYSSVIEETVTNACIYPITVSSSRAYLVATDMINW